MSYQMDPESLLRKNIKQIIEAFPDDYARTLALKDFAAATKEKDYMGSLEIFQQAIKQSDVIANLTKELKAKKALLIYAYEEELYQFVEQIVQAIKNFIEILDRQSEADVTLKDFVLLMHRVNHKSLRYFESFMINRDLPNSLQYDYYLRSQSMVIFKEHVQHNHQFQEAYLALSVTLKTHNIFQSFFDPVYQSEVFITCGEKYLLSLSYEETTTKLAFLPNTNTKLHLLLSWFEKNWAMLGLLAKKEKLPSLLNLMINLPRSLSYYRARTRFFKLFSELSEPVPLRDMIVEDNEALFCHGKVFGAREIIINNLQVLYPVSPADGESTVDSFEERLRELKSPYSCAVLLCKIAYFFIELDDVKMAKRLLLEAYQYALEVKKESSQTQAFADISLGFLQFDEFELGIEIFNQGLDCVKVVKSENTRWRIVHEWSTKLIEKGFVVESIVVASRLHQYEWRLWALFEILKNCLERDLEFDEEIEDKLLYAMKESEG